MASCVLPNVAVVGTGIIGSSIAHHLSSAGCNVTVLDGASKPAEGATGKSWAWLNANRKTPVHYKGRHASPASIDALYGDPATRIDSRRTFAELNKAGMAAWRDLTLPTAESIRLAEFPGTICIGRHSLSTMLMPQFSSPCSEPFAEQVMRETAILRIHQHSSVWQRSVAWSQDWHKALLIAKGGYMRERVRPHPC